MENVGFIEKGVFRGFLTRNEGFGGKIGVWGFLGKKSGKSRGRAGNLGIS